MIIYQHEKSNQSALIQLSGHLDLEGGSTFKQELQELASKTCTTWLIDLAQVSFIDSAGIGALMHGLDLAITHRCRFVLLNPHPSVKMVLEIARLDDLFEIVEGKVEALLDDLGDRAREDIAASYLPEAA